MPTLEFPNSKLGRKTRISQSADRSSSASTRGRKMPRFVLGGLDEQPCFLARVRGSSVFCRAALPHAKAVRNWPSASSVKFASKSTASHYCAALLRCSLAVGLSGLGKRPGWFNISFIVLNNTARNDRQSSAAQR